MHPVLAAAFLCLPVVVACPWLGAQDGPAKDGPALVAETERAVAASRGGSGLGFAIESAILGQTRHIDIALPASFAHSPSARRYPVIVVLDGEADLPQVAAVADELARNGMIPEAVIVAIENIDDFAGRVHDLTPPGLSVSGSSRNEGGDAFLDFIARELLPAVDRQFRGAAPRTLIGHSSGGVLATWAAATRSLFTAVISIDAPVHLGENWLAGQMLTHAAKATAPLRYVSYEAVFGWPEPAWQQLVASKPAVWTLHREKLRLEGHETMFMLASYLGLRQVFCDYSRLAIKDAPTTRVLPHYATVAASFGAPLVPPRRVLRDVTEDLLMEGRGALARAAFEQLVAGYGEPRDKDQLLAEIAEVERRPPPTETVEGLLATPFPTPGEVAAYVGEWVGDEWINEDEPRNHRITLRIAVVDGRVTGETVHRSATGEQMVQPWTHLQVTRSGITWGYMNGMRPRGVLLFEGARDGNTLAGKVRFGGIDFRPPPEMPKLSHCFSFTLAGK